MKTDYNINQLNMKQIENARRMVRKRFPELIERYLQDAANYLNNIEQALQADDFEQVVRSAHALKSSSASLGVTGTWEVAKAFEESAREPETRNMEQLSELALLLRRAYEISEPKLRALLTSAA